MHLHLWYVGQPMNRSFPSALPGCLSPAWAAWRRTGWPREETLATGSQPPGRPGKLDQDLLGIRKSPSGSLWRCDLTAGTCTFWLTEASQKEARAWSALTWSCHVGDVFLCHVSHEADDGEDDKTSKHAGARVYATHDDRVSEERKCKIKGKDLHGFYLSTLSFVKKSQTRPRSKGEGKLEMHRCSVF